MNVEQIFSQVEGKIAKEEFQKRIREKIDEFGGLLSEEGAALIVATDLGVDLRVERPHDFLEIKDLTIGMGDIWLCARVTCVSSIKVFQRDSGIGKVANVEVMDKTGSTRVVLWDDLADTAVKLTKGDIIEVKGGYVKKGFKEGIEIHLSSSRRGFIEKTETDKDIPELKTDYTPIQNLEEEMADVDVAGRVGQVFSIREFQKNGGTGKIASLTLVDDTGEIRLCLWNDKADLVTRLNRGDIIAVESGYTKMGMNGLELHSGWRGRVLPNPDVDIAELPDVKRVDIIDLEPGRSCNVAGTVLEIGEKRSFVKSDGSPGQLASFVVQDKTADIRVVVWNEKADMVERLVQGVPVTIDNGFAKEGMQGLELHVSSVGQIVVEEDFEPEQKIFRLEKGLVELMGRYYNGYVLDESGRVEVVTEEPLEEGQLVRVKGNYDERITAETIDKINAEFPSLESLLHPCRTLLSDIAEGGYVEVYALVKKILEFDTYNRITMDDGSREVTGIVFGDVCEGEEYCFYARVYKREPGVECICYQYHVVEPEKEALNKIKELETLMEV
jgi:ssDNA-binding replication factor A large subunit